MAYNYGRRSAALGAGIVSLTDPALRGVIVPLTGSEPDSESRLGLARFARWAVRGFTEYQKEA